MDAFNAADTIQCQVEDVKKRKKSIMRSARKSCTRGGKQQTRKPTGVSTKSSGKEKQKSSHKRRHKASSSDGNLVSCAMFVLCLHLAMIGV